MEKEFLENQKQLNKEGYVIISSYFLDYGVEILGTEPAMLYIQLLNYCHKGKDLAWPTLVTLGRKMQFTPKSITKFHQVLLKHGLIKRVIKGKTPSGNYNRNIYQVIPIHRVKNTLTTGKIFPKVEEKITPDLGKKLPTNNTNPNITNSTAANREDAAVFKKLREKGEEKMGAVRERMVELGLKEKFIGQLLKGYPVEKIEGKLDLLVERRNIQNPAGWLRTALENDDWGEGEESYPTPHPHLNPPPSRGRRFADCPAQKEKELKEGLETGSQLSPPEWTSREKALEAINLIKDNLSLPVYPSSPQGKGP
jgi:predicted transcriptional regulator